MPLQAWLHILLQAWLHTWLQAWLQGLQYMIHTYVGCGRYIPGNIICLVCAGWHHTAQRATASRYSILAVTVGGTVAGTVVGTGVHAPEGLRIERAIAKEAAAGVGKARCGRAPSLFSPPFASLLHCFIASLLATGYWLLAVTAKVPQPARTARITQDRPGQPSCLLRTTAAKGKKCGEAALVALAWGRPRQRGVCPRRIGPCHQ